MEQQRREMLDRLVELAPAVEEHRRITKAVAALDAAITDDQGRTRGTARRARRAKASA